MRGLLPWVLGGIVMGSMGSLVWRGWGKDLWAPRLSLGLWVGVGMLLARGGGVGWMGVIFFGALFAIAYWDSRTLEVSDLHVVLLAGVLMLWLLVTEGGAAVVRQVGFALGVVFLFGGVRSFFGWLRGVEVLGSGDLGILFLVALALGPWKAVGVVFVAAPLALLHAVTVRGREVCRCDGVYLLYLVAWAVGCEGGIGGVLGVAGAALGAAGVEVGKLREVGAVPFVPALAFASLIVSAGAVSEPFVRLISSMSSFALFPGQCI